MLGSHGCCCRSLYETMICIIPSIVKSRHYSIAEFEQIAIVPQYAI